MILEVVQSKWSLTRYDPLGPRMCVLELMNGHVLQTLQEQLKVPGSRLEGSELLTSEFLRFRSRLNKTSGGLGKIGKLMAFTDFSLLFSHLNEGKGEDQTRPEERVQTQQRFNQKYQQLNNPENTLQAEGKPVRESVTLSTIAGLSIHCLLCGRKGCLEGLSPI